MQPLGASTNSSHPCAPRFAYATPLLRQAADTLPLSLRRICGLAAERLRYGFTCAQGWQLFPPRHPLHLRPLRPSHIRAPSAPAISTTRLPHCPTPSVLGFYKKTFTLWVRRTRPPHDPIFCRHSLRPMESGNILATLVDVTRHVYPLRPKGHAPDGRAHT